MADPEAKRTKTVSNDAIKSIRQMGMSKAIAKYTSGDGDAEFKTAVERFYSPQRLKQASSNAAKTPAAKSATPSPVSSAPAPSKDAIGRKLQPKGMAEGLGAPVSASKPPKAKKKSAFEQAAT